MSCPTVRPATYSQASDSETPSARRPMTATNSTSQSVWPFAGSFTSVTGPLMLVTNLVNTGGSPSGAANPDSAAWSR